MRKMPTASVKVAWATPRGDFRHGNKKFTHEVIDRWAFEIAAGIPARVIAESEGIKSGAQFVRQKIADLKRSRARLK